MDGSANRPGEARGVPPARPRLLVALLLASALSPLGSTMIAVALPSIGREFHIEAGALTQWLVTSYLLVSIVCQSPFGKLGDLFGHTRVLAAGQLACAVGIAAGAFAENVALLVVARVLMAASGAAMVPAAVALLRNRTDPAHRTRAFAAMSSVMALAAASGPLLGGELVARFGWQAVFIANAPLLLLSILLARGERSERSGERPKFDLLGSVLLGAALVGFVTGARATAALQVTLLLSAIAMTIAFVAWERRAPNPVLDLGLFRVPAFTAGAGVIALQNLAMYALLFQLPHFFVDVRGAQASAVGRMLLAMTLSMVAFAFVGARLVDKIGTRFTVVAGAVSALAGVVLLDLQRARSPSDVMPSLVLLGIGLGLATTPSQAAAMESVSREQSGMAAGALSTMRYVGGIGGAAVLGSMLTAKDHARAVAEHHAATWVYAVALALAVLVAVFLPGRSAARHP